MTTVKIDPTDVRAIEPRFESLIQTHLSDNEEVNGWHCTAIDKTGTICLGSGFGADLETARRIAIAETMERAVFRRLLKSKERDIFGLDDHPTSCGFAAGFDAEQVRLRSICEAVERWARAIWIDEKLSLQTTSTRLISQSPLAKYFLAPFNETLVFSQFFNVFDPIKKKTIQLNFGAVVALTSDGAFSGCRVCSYNEDPFEHAALEAWRHYIIFKKHSLPDLSENSFLNRIEYFGTHRIEALHQIGSTRSGAWQVPQIIVHEGTEIVPGKVFIWRTLCGGYGRARKILSEQLR